jgi:hypothetical protein
MGKTWPTLTEIAMVVIAIFVVLAFFKGWG